MESQVESAIELAFNPATEQTLKEQAYQFLNQLREDPNAWQVCLPLFTRHPPASEVVRLVCLEIVNNTVQTLQLGQEGLNVVRFRLMEYIQRRYAPESPDVDSASLQNKLTQTVTYLFTFLYAADWSSFFDEFLSLAGAEGGGAGPTQIAGTVMLLRILGSVHDEIADVMIPRTPDEQKACNDLKDLVRARDVHKIAGIWQSILSNWQHLDLSLVEMCLRTIAKWVSWIDISLVISERMQSALLEIAGQQGSFTSESKQAKARDAAIDTFTETVGKKMSPSDKIGLIEYLNLSAIVGQLVASPALSQLRLTSDYDTDLAETVAKLVNNVLFDIVKVLDPSNVDSQPPETRQKADQLLQTFVPYLLRFFEDEYDEICSAVIPSLTDLLTMFRKVVAKSGTSLPGHYSGMLQPILDAIIAKMKYDDTASWGDEDDRTDEAEFQELRKRLHVLQQTIAAVDEELYMNTLCNVVASTLRRLGSGSNEPNWRDLDLALLEMHHFGELTIRNAGLYAKSKPTSVASSRLLEMMTTMVDSNLASYPHPAVQLQYMEICVRYVQFFEQNTAGIPKVLESFVSLVHTQHKKVRLRSWYLFQRFSKHLRAQLGEYAQTVVQAIADLLTIKAELPADKDDDDISSDDDNQSADATFTNQLYLFESIGSIASTSNVSIDVKIAIAKAVNGPLTLEMSNYLRAARDGDERSILQVHHIIMALGTLANGFSDWTPGIATEAVGSGTGPPPVEMSQEFVGASDSILLALENLKEHSEIRVAARHAFSRLLGVLGTHVLQQLPRWIEGLLSSASSNDEMAMFLRTLGQVVYGFKSEISSILDQLLSPLFSRVFTGLSQPVTGTDDEIQAKELRQQYLIFILVILNEGLSGVLVSPANQASFDSFITSITRFATDPVDPQSARLAFGVLTKITSLWGGPDIPPATSALDHPSPTSPAPTLPGFDAFILARFAPLPWSLIFGPRFAPTDAQIRSVLHEAAVLQWTILRKLGRGYAEALTAELRSFGVGDDGIAAYVQAIGGGGATGDPKDPKDGSANGQAGFKKFFANFVVGLLDAGKRS